MSVSPPSTNRMRSILFRMGIHLPSWDCWHWSLPHRVGGIWWMDIGRWSIWYYVTPPEPNSYYARHMVLRDGAACRSPFGTLISQVRDWRTLARWKLAAIFIRLGIVIEDDFLDDGDDGGGDDWEIEFRNSPLTFGRDVWDRLKDHPDLRR